LKGEDDADDNVPENLELAEDMLCGLWRVAVTEHLAGEIGVSRHIL
jgi:hypothetical protein